MSNRRRKLMDFVIRHSSLVQSMLGIIQNVVNGNEIENLTRSLSWRSSRMKSWFDFLTCLFVPFFLFMSIWIYCGIRGSERDVEKLINERWAPATATCTKCGKKEWKWTLRENEEHQSEFNYSSLVSSFALLDSLQSIFSIFIIILIHS